MERPRGSLHPMDPEAIARLLKGCGLVTFYDKNRIWPLAAGKMAML
jgi:hypothetical protein